MYADVEIRSAVKALALLFYRNGCVRQFNAERREALGAQVYKKGNEARFIAKSEIELADIQQLLTVAGFKYGKSFQHGRQFCVPMYGIAQVERLLGLIAEFAPKEASK